MFASIYTIFTSVDLGKHALAQPAGEFFCIYCIIYINCGVRADPTSTEGLIYRKYITYYIEKALFLLSIRF